MTDFVWPNGVRNSRIDMRHISNSESSPGIFSGSVQTSSRPGDRLGCLIAVEKATGRERAKLQALACLLRGAANRLYLRDFGYVMAGSFPAAELLANSDFSDGVASWTAGSEAAISASDNVLRVKRTANTGSGNAYALQNFSGLTLNAPYTWRSAASAVRGAVNLRNTVSTTTPPSYSELDAAVVGVGYRRTWFNAGTTSGAAYLDNTGASTALAGDYFDVSFASLSRCAVVDAPGNLLTRSDEFDNAAWTKSGSTISANSTTAPDGTATMDALVEDSANTSHNVSQNFTVSSGAQDVMLAVAVKANGRDFCWVQMNENAGSTSVFRYFSLSGSGAVGTTVAVGANWANERSFAVSLGNGCILCVLIARKTNAATSLSALVGTAMADGGGSYAGDGSSGIRLWRATAWPSSYPTQLVQAVSSVVAAQTYSTTTIPIKGLPASTSGLLKRGDQVEIAKILKFLAADLDSDSAGRGVLQLGSPLPRSTGDNEPVVIYQPMARFRLVRDVEYPTIPGRVSDFTFEFEQDLNA